MQEINSSPGQIEKENSTIREIQTALLKQGIWYAETEEEMIIEYLELGEKE